MKWLLVFIACIAIVGCSKTAEEKYKELEKKELSKTERQDDLFFGIYFGMTTQQFSEYCFNKHLEGKFNQGGNKSGTWVECKLPDELKYPAAINFFPEFENNRITEMNASLYYDNPENLDVPIDDDVLLQDVINLLNDWYGGECFRIRSPVSYKDDVFVKINGNRRITITQDKIGHMINLWFVDMKKDGIERNED